MKKDIWQPMETVPYNIPILVLLEKHENHDENDCRIQHAFFHENIITIGDHFVFDKPKAMAWTYPPEIPEHLK